ncbi:AhpC/TSA family protein [Phycisphaerae bacterium RAS1]|nr:AhpC/TSA family protein [Phycisphaerae bacterium RAS1]
MLRPALLLFATFLLVSPSTAQIVDEPLPEYKLTDVKNGEKEFAIAEGRGRILVLFFFKSTDAGSADVVAEVKKVAKMPGVHVIAISPEKPDAVEKFAKAKEFEFSYVAGADAEDFFQISSYPRAYVVDTKGVLRWRGHPGELEERVKDQIRKTPPIGADPESLKARLAKANKLMAEKQFGKAYTLASQVASVASTGGGAAGGSDATALAQKAEEGAKQRIEEARKLIEEKKIDQAIAVLADIAVRFGAKDAAREAETELAKLQSNREHKALVRKATDNVRGEMRNEEAADLIANKQYVEAVDTFKQTIERYPESKAAADAQKQIDKINADASVKTIIAKRRSEQEADRWLEIGDRFAKVELYDQAREWYDKVQKQHAGTAAADKAKKAAAKLPKTADAGKKETKPKSNGDESAKQDKKNG